LEKSLKEASIDISALDLFATLRPIKVV